MVKRILVLCLLLGIGGLFTNCKTEHSGQTPTENTQGSDYVIQPRNKSLPRQVSRAILLTDAMGSLRSETFEDDPYRYIGHGYKAGNGIIGDPSNLTYPIVNVSKLRDDPKMRDNINKVTVRSAASEVYAFSDYQSYLASSKDTKKVSVQLSLPTFIPFSLGFQSSYESTFSSSVNSSKKQIWGLVNLFYKESNIKLNTTSYALSKISEKYLSSAFIGSLYNSSVYDLIQNFGGYVVCDYTVGGRATATYLHNYSEQGLSTTKKFKNTLGLSFSWGESDNNNSFGFSTERIKKDSILQKVSAEEIYNKIQVYGGDPTTSLSTSASLIENNNIDLTNWLHSLKNREKLVMIDVNERGLLGLDYFVIEENIQKMIRDINDGFDRSKRLELPFISIERVATMVNERSSKQIAMILNTRYCDKVIFLSDKIDNSKVDFKEEAKRIVQNVSNVFEGIEIVGKPKGSINPLFRTKYSCVVIPYEFGDLNWYKYKSPHTEVVYVYDPSKKIALSFLDEEEYIPDVYGLSEWLRKLPERKISMFFLLNNYRVIGI